MTTRVVTTGASLVAYVLQLAGFSRDTEGSVTLFVACCRSGIKLSGLQLKKRLMEISAKPRVLYRIGDLVIHRRYGYRGVIYGHDPECSAPREWQEAMKIDLLSEGANQPFYHVLVDTRDRPGGMSTYVAQENLMVQQDPMPVLHPWLPKACCSPLLRTY